MHCRMKTRVPIRRPFLLSAALFTLLPASLAGQGGRSLGVSLPHGPGNAIQIASHRGYPAFDASALGPLGWGAATRPDGEDVVLRHRSGLTLRFTPGSPFFLWDDGLLQTAHAPYWFGESLYLPVQLLVDLFPGLLPRAYRFDSERFVLQVEGAGDASEATVRNPVPGSLSTLPPAATPTGARAPRIVVIDPGHGGEDPGAIGGRGTREKDVALAMAMALARELANDPEIEVRLTRDRDVAVPIWSRGELATEWKGDRPGVFISIHANALPDRTGVRGFETYFLSEARDEHERRVAALENAPLAAGPSPGGATAGDPLLGAILRDLRTFDHQHWSAALADQVQRELGDFHPGPDRGVKQGPFAVITNSMMPSVLVELGFITNPDEERLLSHTEFHRDTARAMARAIRRFFESYPTGQ